MRYLSMILGAGLLLSVGLLSGSGPAHAAMPALEMDSAAVATTLIEKAGYYYRRRHYGYRHGYRPYYGYGYRNYGYGYRRPFVGFGFGYGRRWRY